MKIHPIDVYVGDQIRAERILNGKIQVELAHEIGVRFQQVQKYETGKNRVSASRLWMISKCLDVPISTFFPQESETETHELRGYSHQDLQFLSQIRRLGDPERQVVQDLLGFLIDNTERNEKSG